MKVKEPAKIKVLQVRLKSPEELRLYKDMRMWLVENCTSYQEWGVAQIREAIYGKGKKRGRK